MRREAGISPSESIVSAPEKKRLSPSEIQDVITRSHLGIYRNENKSPREDTSSKFFDEYKTTPDGSQTIEKLTKIIPTLTAEEIQQSYISGLSKNLFVAGNIPKLLLSNCQEKDIADAFAHRFSLVVESLGRVSAIFPPSKSIAKQIIQYPNYLEPNFYEFFVNQIKEDGYYCRANICFYLNRSPKHAKKNLEQNNEIFESIIKLLAGKKSTLVINYPKIRIKVGQQQGKAINIISKAPDDYFVDIKEKEEIKKEKTVKDEKISKLISEKKDLQSENRILKAEIKELLAAKRKLDAEKKNLISQIDQLKNKIVKKENENKTIAFDDIKTRCHQAGELISASHHPPTYTNPEASKNNVYQQPKRHTKLTQEEILLAREFVPSHPIDHVSSENLTIEQQNKIEKIKAKNLKDSFAQDWVIEYYVIHYPDNTEEKLEEDLNKLIAWKETLLDEEFKDNWILKHFIVYYPDDYKSRYFETKKTFNRLKRDFPKEGFTAPDILKYITVYYHKDHTKAIKKGILLYEELKKEFLETELIKSNSSKISRYIIRNFNNPSEDLRKATEQYNLLLKNAIETPGDFFHSQGENEFSSDDYLQLLFESYPMPTESSIAKIKDAYQKLQTQFSYDNFFGKYKKSALKKISISSTEKFALGYFKLKRIIEKDVDDPKNKGIDPEKIVRIHLFSAENRIPLLLEYCRNLYRQKKFSSTKKGT